MPTMTLNFNEKIQTSVQVGDMILYSNPNGLLGYFAKVCFKNDSKTEAELFSVGAGVFESSK
jgi:hypothetical protein